jgi:tRNA uridine 5-carboxymethylaminomethyl modification enzyme
MALFRQRFPVMQFPSRFDVIVVGGGHAGTEAALAAARTGARTLLLTHSIETLGQMSCNPSIGGIGKGHLVKEVDALGGAMALATDEAGIQFRTLNSSKGPAVRATRAQADRVLYKRAIRKRLENQPNLTLFQQAVDDLLLDGDRVCGVVTQIGLTFRADAVVLTAGTFLSGRIHVGLQNYEAGRAGDPPAKRLGARLRELNLPVGRLKTGTPPRLDGRTIDFSMLEVQPGDDPPPVFSFIGTRDMHPAQLPCWITHTNAQTHDIIRSGLDRSPMYSGVIKSTGPRYCPSIEDKVVRFAQRESHQIYLEPEGLDTHEIYPNGISTSLPFDVSSTSSTRCAAARTRTSCGRVRDRVRLLRSARLKSTLETKAIAGCSSPARSTARRVRGSGGAGPARRLNAARGARRRGLVPARGRGVPGRAGRRPHHRGCHEPYRMFTSRAEYRLQLREDNADLRLTEHGGASAGRRCAWDAFGRKRDAIETRARALDTTFVQPQLVPMRRRTRAWASA